MNQQGLPDNTVSSVRKYVEDKLIPILGERETRQHILLIFKHVLNWSSAELVLHQKERLTESQILQLHFLAKEIITGRPIQYILGKTFFYGREFRVNDQVLIPRPETEELVQKVIETNKLLQPKILDIGTGSGCIAISLKLEIPKSIVTAVDVSKGSLEMARRNAEALAADIEFFEQDILVDEPPGMFDIIVSNPPYIPLSEHSSISETVKDHEPNIALFVPQDAPLLFYRRIREISLQKLTSGGFVALECHELFAKDVLQLFAEKGFFQSSIYCDLQGKERFVLASKN